MYCKKCGAQINENNKFCTNCGTPITNKENTPELLEENKTSNSLQELPELGNNNHQDQVDYSNSYSNTPNQVENEHQDQFKYQKEYSGAINDNINNSNTQNQNQINSDKDYIKAYVGENYDKIKEGKFSIPGFLLSSYYMLYRKMFFEAILLVIINIILIYCFPPYGILIDLALIILVGFKINQYYLKVAEKKVNEIKTANPDKSTTEIYNKCKKQGGTSMVTPIIFAVIFFVVATITIVTYAVIVVTNESKSSNTISSEEKLEDENIINKLNYNIPSTFKLNEYSSNDFRMYFTQINDTNNNCEININYNKYGELYNSSQEYLQNRISTSSGEISEITETTINNIKFTTATIEKENVNEITKEKKIFKYNYLVTKKNNDIYFIEEAIYSEENNECTNAFKDFNKTLKLD